MEKKNGICPECGAPCEVIEGTYKEEIHDVHYIEHKFNPPTGAVWVKASEFKYEARKSYYAKWLDGKVKATGWFQESDGTFFWNVPGYVPILKGEHEYLRILDESTDSIH
jgi:hypothetical protein